METVGIKQKMWAPVCPVVKYLSDSRTGEKKRFIALYILMKCEQTACVLINYPLQTKSAAQAERRLMDKINYSASNRRREEKVIQQLNLCGFH